MPYLVFISAAKRDIDIAEDLGQRLVQIGVAVSFSQEYEKPEEFIVQEALREADELIIIFSNNSLNDSALMFEMGAGFTLRKRVTPIVIGLKAEELPMIIKEMDYIKYADLQVYIGNLKERAQLPPSKESTWLKSSKLRKKKTARIICANDNEFWTTQKQFWLWVREGLIDVTGQKPLTGRFGGRREKLLVMVRHIILDSSPTEGKQEFIGSYSRLKPKIVKHHQEGH